MKKTAINKKVQHSIDLTKIDGDGAFPCPNCGVVISPEDETEQVYRIIDTKVRNDGLFELTIMCNSCKTEMRLTGFQQ